MIDFIQMLWDSLLIPLAWMPPFCANIIAGFGMAVIAYVFISISIKIATYLSTLR